MPAAAFAKLPLGTIRTGTRLAAVLVPELIGLEIDYMGQVL